MENQQKIFQKKSFSEIPNLNNIMGLKMQSSQYHILKSVLLFITFAVWRCTTPSVYLPCCLTLLSVNTCWCTLHCNDSSARCAFFNTVCDWNRATKVQLCAEFVNVWSQTVSLAAVMCLKSMWKKQDNILKQKISFTTNMKNRSLNC